MKNQNPFKECPVYESENLLFTKVKEEDAQELYQCYSDLTTLKHMNNDNCGGDWDCSSVEVMRRGISGWEQEFKDGFYIRWSVKNILENRIIGTIEIAPFPNTTRFISGGCETGILRIDLISYCEREAVYQEILNVVSDNMYEDFNIKNIIVKGPNGERAKVESLVSCGFKGVPEGFIRYEDYYIKSK